MGTFGAWQAGMNEAAQRDLAAARREIVKLKEGSTCSTLARLADASQSVVLTTLEDNSGWECSAIVGGKRYTAFGVTPDAAARLCNIKVAEGATEPR